MLVTAARAADPVVVQLPDRATARTAVVTVGDVATVSGGTPADRAAVAALDVAELKPRQSSASLSRRTVEYRVLLAGLSTVKVTGAERTDVVLARRAVTTDEVAAAVKAELLRQIPWAGETVSADLALPIVVTLPDIPAGETLSVSATPHAAVTKPGRVQMDTTLSAGGQRLLTLAVYFDVQPARPPTSPGSVPQLPAPVAGAARSPLAPLMPVPPAGLARPGGEVVVKAGERVRMTVRSGALTVTAAGEAQQAGRVGDAVRVQNVDSRKVVSGRVTGPGAVEVEPGGAP
jgi:flagella basal body P-ring formation protein FlgA